MSIPGRRNFLKTSLAAAGATVITPFVISCSNKTSHSNVILSVGCAKRDITPDIGHLYTGDGEQDDLVKEIDGSHLVRTDYFEDPLAGDLATLVEEIDAPLFVRAVYFEDSTGTRFILAMADVGGFTRDQDRSMRLAMAKATGLHYENVRINPTHNHTAPNTYLSINEIFREYRVPPFADESWVKRIEDSFVDAALEAKSGLQPVTVRGGAARVKGIAANRTVYFEDGAAGTRFGFGNTDEMKRAPEGLIDPDVDVLQLIGASGNPVVTIFSYACHPTAVGRRGELISPDFPGYASEIIERETDGMAFFIQGTGGNVGTGKYADGSVETSRNMGIKLAGSVFSALQDPHSCKAAPLTLKTWKERIELDPRLPSLEQAREELGKLVSSGVRDSSLWLLAALIEVLEDRERSSLCDMFLLEGGDWCLAGLPAESFVESGLAIKSASPHPVTLVGGYFDCTLWYIPTRRAYRDDVFETTGGWNYAAPGASEQITRSVIARLI